MTTIQTKELLLMKYYFLNSTWVRLLVAVFIYFNFTFAYAADKQGETYLMETYVYKRVGDLEIKADVYRNPGNDIRPVIFWIHGGALISGSRTGLPPANQFEEYLKAGYVIVSIDYRLAPETKLKAIIEDVEDAYSWVLSRGPELLNIDPNNIAVMGMSAGGYLTLTAGFRFEPRPKALVSLYGYGDITGSWISEPKPALIDFPPVQREVAMRAVKGPAITNTDSLTMDQLKERGSFGLYVMQNGLWTKEVSGYDFRAVPKWFKSYEPRQNVTKDYPPTMLLHGEKDQDTLFPQIVMMAEELKRHNVEYEFITNPDWGHGFDYEEDDPTVQDAHRRVLNFLEKHLK